MIGKRLVMTVAVALFTALLVAQNPGNLGFECRFVAKWCQDYNVQFDCNPNCQVWCRRCSTPTTTSLQAKECKWTGDSDVSCTPTTKQCFDAYWVYYVCINNLCSTIGATPTTEPCDESMSWCTV